MTKKNLKLMLFLLLGLLSFLAAGDAAAKSPTKQMDPCTAYVQFETSMEMAHAGAGSYNNPYAATASAECKQKYAADKAKREAANPDTADITTKGRFYELNKESLEILKKEADDCFLATQSLMGPILTAMLKKQGEVRTLGWNWWSVQRHLETIINNYTSTGWSLDTPDGLAAKIASGSMPAKQLTPDESSISALDKMLKSDFAKSDPALQSSLASMVDTYTKKARECIVKADKVSGLGSNFKDAEVYVWVEQDCGADGKKNGKPCQTVVFRKDGSKLIGVGGVMDGCAPLMVKLGEAKQCKFCALFESFYTAAKKISIRAYGSLASAISHIVLIALALYIAFKFLPYMTSFTKQDAPKVLSEILVQAGKTLFVWFLLQDSTFVYGYFVGPILSAGLDFGTNTLYGGQNLDFSCGELNAFSTTDTFPPALFAQINCFVLKVQHQLAMTDAVGSTLMCVARHKGQVPLFKKFGMEVKFWNFTMMFIGLVIYIFSWLIAFAFGFYLLDAIVRLCIVGALMPLLIGCWTFGITRSYTQKGWTILMNAFFTFVFMGLVISVVTELMYQGATGGQGGIDEIAEVLNSDRVDEMKKMFDIGFSGFLTLFACCLIGFKLVGQTEQLAEQWSGGGGFKGIGGQIGGMAASAVKAVAKVAATAVLGAVTGGAGAAIGGKAGMAIKSLGSKSLGTQKGIAGVLNRAAARGGAKANKFVASKGKAVKGAFSGKKDNKQENKPENKKEDKA